MDIIDLISIKKEVTCLYGGAGSGKTNICHLAAAKEQGKVIFVDAENTFSSKRILEFNPSANMEKIIILKPKHFFNLHKAIGSLLKVKNRPSLVIVDSINKFYRKRISVDERTNKYFARQLQVLGEISQSVPVLITAQVSQKSTGETTPVGGNMLKSFCQRLFFLEKKEKRTIYEEKPKQGQTSFEIAQNTIACL